MTAAGDFERHRSDRVAIRRQPVGIGEKEFAPWFELHYRRMQRAAETAQNLVTPFGWFPLDRVASEPPRHADRLLGVPPRRQRLCVEEGFPYFAQSRRNHEVGAELEHASLCPFDVLNR